jgi:hypothetical protein
MDHFGGLDVSVKETSICIVDDTGRIVNPMRPPELGHVSGAARCGAKTRSGAPCKSAPVTGRRRCRMHGGAAGSGAPSGERNGNFRHGRYTKEVAATRRWIREAIELLRKSR